MSMSMCQCQYANVNVPVPVFRLLALHSLECQQEEEDRLGDKGGCARYCRGGSTYNTVEYSEVQYLYYSLAVPGLLWRP